MTDAKAIEIVDGPAVALGKRAAVRRGPFAGCFALWEGACQDKEVLVGAKRFRRGQGILGSMPSATCSLNLWKNNVTANTQLALAA